MSNYLHGVETVEYLVGPSQVQTIATAVIGLVGTAPIQTLSDPTKASINKPILITSDKDAAAYFGADATGYSIPSALSAIFAQGAGPVIVVNVFDPTKVSMQTGGQPDPTKVTAGDIYGTTLGDGTRTGLMALLDARSLFGFGPKQIIAPGYTNLTGVVQQMDVIAAKLRAICWVDLPVGLSPQDAVSSRSTTLNTASKRVMICYPHVQALGPDGTTLVLRPLSQYAAGVCAAVDQAKGYWWSPSNTALAGVVSLERPVDGSFQDSGSDLNLLNGAGITTIYAAYGTGFKLWGNRSAAYPGSTEVDVFMAVRRTADIIEEALELNSLKYIDRPLSKALIDQQLDDDNAFLRDLIGRGATVDAKAFFDSTQNPAQELAAGHLTLGYRFAPPPPMERLSYEAYLDSNLYTSVTK
jgi:phage tail sheath protein FI